MINLYHFAIILQGTGDKYCEFSLHKSRERGHVSLESVAKKGIYIGLTGEGKVKPQVDTGDKNVRLYPQVIECEYCTMKE